METCRTDQVTILESSTGSYFFRLEADVFLAAGFFDDFFFAGMNITSNHVNHVLLGFHELCCKEIYRR